jgi:hypothetical protein
LLVVVEEVFHDSALAINAFDPRFIGEHIDAQCNERWFLFSVANSLHDIVEVFNYEIDKKYGVFHDGNIQTDSVVVVKRKIEVVR